MNAIYEDETGRNPSDDACITVSMLLWWCGVCGVVCGCLRQLVLVICAFSPNYIWPPLIPSLSFSLSSSYSSNFAKRDPTTNLAQHPYVSLAIRTVTSF